MSTSTCKRLVWLSLAVTAGVLNLLRAQAPAGMPNAQQVLAYLNQSLDWHHRVAAEEEIASDAGDVLFLAEDKQLSLQALKLSFDFARAVAQSSAVPGSPGTAEASAPPEYQSLSAASTQAQQTLTQTQAELQGVKRQLESAQGKKRVELQATADELQAEIDLAQARAQALHEVVQFVNSGSAVAGSLRAQIDDLEKAAPELQAQAQTPAGSAAPPSAPSASPTAARPARPEPSGVLALITDLISLGRKVRVLDDSAAATDQLAASLKQVRAPLIAGLQSAAKQGEQIAKQADTSNAAQLMQEKKDLDNITAQFRRFSAAAVPLGKQAILLDAYRNNLRLWRDAVREQRSTELRSLVFRLVIFGIIIVVAIVLSEVWQKAIFRYVHDARRRYQFLLLRRIILWCVIALTIAFALASEIGSLATFAGLITAGVAVALQNVILAVAGYFFLIGKYGVRVGDRVQISGVTGEVVDIGLIRLHLMELGGPESARQPTGRVVVFSNSIVFQPTASFFKQIPGTNFVWHEVSLVLAPGTDYRVAEERMLKAVQKVYGSYKERIEQQHRTMEQTLNLAVRVPRPQSRLRLTEAGLQMIVRYPVELDASGETDDQVTRELLAALAQPPALRLVGSAKPIIQPVEPPAAAEP